MTKSVIINPFTPIPKSEKSHVRGWAMMWAQRLGADIGDKDTNIYDYDMIYIDHGVNFSGSLNLFGGFTDEVHDRLDDIIKVCYEGHDVLFLDHSVKYCNYAEQIRKRLGSKTTTSYLTEEFIDKLDGTFGGCGTLTQDNIKSRSLILGDSHSQAFSLPHQNIKRINGQTLYSVLRYGLSQFITNNSKKHHKEIDLCLGSIDIRHHCFHNNGMDPEVFAGLYANEIIKAQNELGVVIDICIPVPIEYEGRKIPKSGQYDGRNFSGYREERLDFTLRFIDELDSYCTDFDLISPPEEWYKMDGEEYAKEIMELSSSVHISPKNYRSILGW